MKSFTILLYIALCNCSIVFAQSYTIDGAYGINGTACIKSTDSLHSVESTSASAIDALGRISFLHRHYDDSDVYHISPGIIRFAASGLGVDTSFGVMGVAQKTLLPKSGVSLFNFNLNNCIYTTAEDGFVIGGQKKRYNFNDYTSYALKFSTNGIIQSSFGTNGTFIDSTYKTFRPFEIHSKIGGGFLILSLDNATMENVLYALKPNGRIDSSFGNNGFQFFAMYGLPFEDVQYKSVSVINNAYYISYIAIDSNVGKYSPKYSGFIKLKPDGQPDITFGNFGKIIVNSHTRNKFMEIYGVITNVNYTTAIAQNNIVVKMKDSTTAKNYICMFSTQGYLDTTFGINGYTLFYPPQNSTCSTNIMRLQVLSNRKIIVVGQTIDTALSVYTVSYFVAIYNANGVIDTMFGTNGYYNLSNAIPTANFSANILSIDSNSFYVTGFKKDASTTNYFDGYYCIIKFKNANSPSAIFINNELQQSINLYPNPGESTITIDSKNTILQVQISSTNGQVIDAIGVNQKKQMIHIEHLPKGTYFLKITTSIGLVVKQFVKE